MNKIPRPKLYHRSIRLKGYDYTRAGAYFVTICTKNRNHYFGNIVDDRMELSEIGKIINQSLIEIPNHFNTVHLDEYIIMPNHLHGVLVIIDRGCRGTACRAPTFEQFGKPVPNSIPTVIRSFKSAVTKKINVTQHTIGTPVWQRNYYEHIIRNEDKLNRICEYIINNPLQWQFDRENPERIQDGVYDKEWGHLEEAIYGKTKQ